MAELTLLLEGGVLAVGTPTATAPTEVSLLAQAAEVDGVMLQDVELHSGGDTRHLPWLYVAFSRILACGVAEEVDEDAARTRLSDVVQGIRKSQFSSRGAHEGLRAVEGE